MAVIPEVILQRAIIQGFRQIRKDSRILDVIFRNLHQDQLAHVKEFLLNTSIDFSINYPKKDLRLPSFVLLLKNESEGQTFLGNVMGQELDQEHIIDTLGGHGASITNSKGLARLIPGGSGILVDEQSGSSTITFQEDQDDLIEYIQKNPIGCEKLYVVKGTGTGQIHNIQRIRVDGLDIEGTFSVQLDDTSVIDIREPDDAELSTGEPSRVYNVDGDFIRKGVNYDVTYQIHVLASQQIEVIYLYSVLKALLLSQTNFLESQGIMAVRISGSDFAPRSDYLPTDVFQRMMTLQCVIPFSFLEELETFDQFQLNILPTPYDDAVLEVLTGDPVTIT